MLLVEVIRVPTGLKIIPVCGELTKKMYFCLSNFSNKPNMAETKKPEAQTEEKKTDSAKAVKKAPPVAKRSSQKDKKPDAEESIESALDKTEGFLYNNGKSLLIALAVIIVIIGGILAYKYIYLPNRSEKAGEMMFVAEQLFASQSYEQALNGDGNNPGFLDVIDTYGSTPQGNVAKHYAGICYMKLGDPDAALEQLGQYKQTKGVPAQIVNAQNYGLRGDIYADKADYENAAAMYKKAVEASDNLLTAPMYLNKEGLAYAKLGKVKESQEAFQKIVDLYPGSVEGQNALKYLGAEEQK